MKTANKAALDGICSISTLIANRSGAGVWAIEKNNRVES